MTTGTRGMREPAPPPCEDTARECLSPDIGPASTAVLGVPASGTVRNVGFLSHPVCGIFLTAARADRDPRGGQ